MKRLSGGLVLLNLTAISLGLTSGEVDITDAGVLEELTELRQFIDVNRDFSKGFKNLKPILIEYRSSASKFNGIALANMSFHTDALHLTIGCLVNNNGKYLNISINVVYEWEDYTGYKVKTAKINAYEKTALTGATIIGDVDVTGDVNVTGDVEVAGAITGDEIVEKMSGYSASLGELEGLTIESVFSGAVKNGNKLTLVCAVNLTRTAEITTGLTLCVFNVPSVVFNKLYPARVGSYDYLDNKVVNAWSSDNTYKELVSYILKASDNIQFKIDSVPLGELTLNTKYYYRYEVTFLLSDNLISNE